jgi:hypothetical protein
MRSGLLRDAYGPSIEYFISTGQTPSDIELLIINLEDELASLRIEVVDKPPYTPEYLIDEKKLTEIFEANIQYRNHLAPQRDVDSVSAIMRLRYGAEYFFVEECKAIFITTNKAIVRLSRDYFYQDAKFDAVPPSMTDYLLTNLLWLKKPLKAPNLPRKRIIADYYAATQPQERTWKFFLTEIEKLKQSNHVTPDDYYLLRYSQEARSALMDITLGGEEPFTQGTVPEILALVHSRIQKGKEEEIKQEIELRKEAENMASSMQAEKRERLMRIRLRSQRYARVITLWIEIFALLLLFIGTLTTFPWELPTVTSKPLNYLIFLIQATLLILSVSNIMYGTMIKSYLIKIEVWISSMIEKNILSLSEN